MVRMFSAVCLTYSNLYYKPFADIRNIASGFLLSAQSIKQKLIYNINYYCEYFLKII